MKKFFSLFLMFFLFGMLNAQTVTIFSEGMGTEAPTSTPFPSVATYTGFENYGIYTFSGDADVRGNQICGLAGSSGASNVFITNIVGRYFAISGINSSGYSSIQLSFNIWKQGAASNPLNSEQFVVEVATDYNSETNTGTFSALSYPTISTGSAWASVTISGGAIPASPNLTIRFRQNQTSQQLRIDDVKLFAVQESGGGVPAVVISGLYGGGGNANAPFRNDYIELYNTTDAPISLEGYTLYYTNAAGTSAATANTYTFLPGDLTIGAKKFALLKAASGTTVLTEWPIDFDFDLSHNSTSIFGMAAGSGKVLLLSTYTNLTAANSIPATLEGIQAMTGYVDFVPYGATNIPAGHVFGATFADLTNTLAAKRRYNDDTQTMAYTFNVANDFDRVTVDANTPRNSSYGEVEPLDCDVFEDFEAAAWAGTNSANYTNRTVTSPSGIWSISAVTQPSTPDANDRKNGLRSARFRGNATDTENIHRVEMGFDIAGGIGTVKFAYGSYGTHGGGEINIQYSRNQGATWTTIESITVPTWIVGSVLQQANIVANIPGPARIRITKTPQAGSTSVNIDDICITEFVETIVATPTFSPPGGNVFAPLTVSIDCATSGATIHYTTDGSEPTASSHVYNNVPIPVSSTTTIKAIGIRAGLDNSVVATATYSFPIEVANIAAFKAANTPPNSNVYKITGDVTFVYNYVTGNNRSIYIKDDSGGLVIFDNSSTITKNYNHGDVISGGVFGSCNMYFGLYQLIPVRDLAAGTPGPVVEPIVVTMSNLLANFSQYESQLIKLEEITFADGTFGTGAAGNIGISQSGSSMICRNHFGNITGFETNSNSRYDVTGFAIPYNADRQIAPRDLNDISEIKYTITLSSSPSGVGTLTGGGVYSYNAPVIINATPSAAYNFVNWTENGAVVTTNQQYSFNALADRTFVANFIMKTYTITASVSGGNGTINPSGTITVNHGATHAYTMIPNPGYEIHEVLINGVLTPVTINPATEVGTYSFTNVTANQTIVVSFKPKQYILTLNPSTGNPVTPASITVTYAQPIGTLPIPTQPNCFFMRWEIDGTPITATTIWNYTTHKTAIAIFEYPIVATNLTPALGTLVPSGTIRYNLGATQAYVATPNPGNYVATVLVDGVVPANFTPNSESSAPYTYTFSNINAYHSIQVSFARNCYAMNVGSVGAATVTMSPTGCVPYGQNVTFTVKADCHKFQVKIGDQTFPWNNTIANNEVFTHTMPVTGPLPFITVVTEEINYTVTASPAPGIDAMGHIEPFGVINVECGSNLLFTFVRTPGHRVRALYVDDEPVHVPPSMSHYLMNNIRKNRTISAEFEEFTQYVIQFGPNPAQGGGRVYPETAPTTTANYVYVDSADNYKFIIAADPGFAIDKVIVDGFNIVAAVQAGHYTFSDIRNHHTIYATFKPIMYTIMATTDGNGTILPGGIVPVAHGTSETFAVFPNTRYKVDTIFVNGVYHEEATNNHYYTFVNVRGDSTIHATFKKMEYTITATAGDYGTINPVGIATVEYGDSKTYTFIPNTGYSIDVVLINNVPNVAAALNGYHTFTNINQNHTIHVTFVKQTFTITSTATVGGTINPSGTITLEYGDHSPIYVIAPEDGYMVSQVLVDGANNYFALDELTYRFLDVTANHTIHVIFAPSTYKITATASPGGTINPQGSVMVASGTDMYFTFEPELGYELALVLIDGDNNTEAVLAGNHTFPNVMAEHTISAVFEKKYYNIFLPNTTGVVVNPVNGSSTQVEHGAKFMFDVSLVEGYTQSNFVVRANGLVVNATGGVYTVSNIMSDQTITVSGVELNKYRVVAKATAGGTLTPAGTFMLTHGDSQLFEMQPYANYKIDKVLVNNIPVVVEEYSYLLENITANTTVDVYYLYNVGIEENDVTSITVFSHDKVVSIVNEMLVPIKSVEIVDMYGRVVWSGAASGDRTDILLSVATGIYGVRITTESNNTSVTKVTIR